VRTLTVTFPLAVAFLLVGTACGSEDTAGPRGPAADVVAEAPGRTLAAGSARVAGAGKAVVTTGRLDLATGRADLEVEGRGDPQAWLTDPILAIDAVAGAVNIRSYGGVQVEKASAFRYEVDIDPAKALAAVPAERRARLAAVLPDERFFADVFVDAAGRIRRVLLPLDLSEPRPMGDEKRVAAALTIDFHDFPEDS
jgi:hypothetical protein